MRIVVETVDRPSRYPTVGDWYFDGNDLHVEVATMGQTNQLLVVVHEIVEAFLCRWDGVSEADVTAFDKEYERLRHDGDESEPGDHQDSPYRKQHQIATSVERVLCHMIGEDWSVHEQRVLEAV